MNKALDRFYVVCVLHDCSAHTHTHIHIHMVITQLKLSRDIMSYLNLILEVVSVFLVTDVSCPQASCTIILAALHLAPNHCCVEHLRHNSNITRCRQI
jgi:hypothetical protein